VILLNKTDLVSAADLRATEDLLSKINPTITIHRTVRADIDIKHVLNIRAYASRGLSRAGTPPSGDHDHALHDGENPSMSTTRITRYAVSRVYGSAARCCRPSS
jgi:G3E family GTPase